MLHKPMVVITRARDLESVLQGMTHHTKSENYRFLHDWMGLDEKWRVHRKVLTPAFHFNILHEFLPIFNKHALKLTECLAAEPDSTAPKGFNIFPYSSLCSLDIICESSMGCRIDAQSNRKSPYVQAIIKLSELTVRRYFTPWLRLDPLFNFTPTKREYDQNLNVITERRKYQKSRGFSNLTSEPEDNDGGRRRLAFLDLLLAAEADGSQFMTQKDIRDQVSTFMFEGHDTVSTATCWVLFILGTYPDAQRRVVEELEEVFGDSGRAPDMADLAKLKYLERCIKETLRIYPSVPFFERRAPDMADLANLKYLERCIKETLRIYPSVPFFERSIESDAQTEYHMIPSGCTVSVNVYMLHRDPEFWPDPEKFDPDRFLPENSQGRHPYSYVPFSAGPRNCIGNVRQQRDAMQSDSEVLCVAGQKFALLEEKVVVSTVLRRFRVEAAHSRDEADLQINLVLRPGNGLHLRLYDRDSHPKLRVTC
ncbi:hypothetical protein B566_EDAN014758 [Ephemera danica]|nr:hypothetical protein B566_EDAN014758 [Ephemera danica]